ncbi:MAG TPA: hypothetical protein DGR79_01035 [Clostridiales bacterium]|nr:hypothetical protein [Clostridiales bacterium]
MVGGWGKGCPPSVGGSRELPSNKAPADRGSPAGGAQAPETVQLAIGSLANALDLLGNVYNDVRDALNEFVANAYDEFMMGGIRNGVVQVRLMPRARPPRIVVTDNGRGMTREDLLRIAKNIAKSIKPESRTPSLEVIGEKGIGILGFQTLAERCQIVTRHQDSDETLCLEFTKGSARAALHTRGRAGLLEIPSTEVHLIGVDERTFRVMTLPKLLEYFQQRWRRPLAEEAFRLFVVHGKRSVQVRPGRYEGEPFFYRARTPLGYVEFELYLTPRTQARRRAAVVGVGGVQILTDITQDPEFDRHPWNSDQVQGEVRFAALKQTTGRRGVQHDRRVFPLFVAAVQEVERDLVRRIERLNREQESLVDAKLTRAIRQAFRKALSEIEALSATGLKVKIADPAGAEAEGTLFDTEVAAARDGAAGGEEEGAGAREETGGPGETSQEAQEPTPDRVKDAVEGEKGRTRQSSAPGLNHRQVPFEDARLRSRYNEALRTIDINTLHPDYRRARRHDRRAFLDYLVLLVAKELTLLNYGGIDQAELLERNAELLARVQLHLPKRL